MKRPSMKRPARFFAWWMVGLGACAACAVALNVALARYAEQSRERNPATHVASAREHMAAGDVLGAYELLDKAVQCAPDSPVTWQMAGDVCFEARKWDRALVWYDHALALGGSHPGLRTNKLWALIELGKHEDAMAFGKESISEGFTTPLIYRYVAEAHIREGQPVEAIPYLEEALKASPRDLYLLEHLLIGYRQAGDEPRATQTSQRISEVHTAINATAMGGR